MSYAQRIDGNWTEITGAFTDAAGTWFPPGWLDGTTPQWRTAHGVFPIAEPDDPPTGQRIVGASLVDRDGRPARIYDLEPIPADELRAPHVAAIEAERARRLALGFDFDFGDARGVHRIGTTPDDMKGWDEVTSSAQAFINLGQGDREMGIVTDTGSVELTVTEWQQVLAQATEVRQPIYAASFALQAMDPIPEDVADDRYWPR